MAQHRTRRRYEDFHYLVASYRNGRFRTSRFDHQPGRTNSNPKLAAVASRPHTGEVAALECQTRSLGNNCYAQDGWGNANTSRNARQVVRRTTRKTRTENEVQLRGKYIHIEKLRHERGLGKDAELWTGQRRMHLHHPNFNKY